MLIYVYETPESYNKTIIYVQYVFFNAHVNKEFAVGSLNWLL